MHGLRIAARGADEIRILIYSPDPAQDGRHVSEMVTITGRPKVDDFLNQIRLRPSILECRCAGMTEIQLVGRDQPLVRLNYMGDAFRWWSGKWWTRGELTAAAQRNISRWLDVNGGAEYARAQANARKRLAAWRAKLAAEYPDRPESTQPATATSSGPE
jgi:hypothetical protein